MMSLTFGLFTQLSDSGSHGPLVLIMTYEANAVIIILQHGLECLELVYLLKISTGTKD